MERGLSMFALCKFMAHRWESEREMSNLTHDENTVRAYSQNILQEVLLLTKHMQNFAYDSTGLSRGS
jgi:hypothetical protein